MGLYKVQKKKVQKLVKEAVTQSERKATEDIRNSLNKSKSIFESIDKLEKKERGEEDYYTRNQINKCTEEHYTHWIE